MACTICTNSMPSRAIPCGAVPHWAATRHYGPSLLLSHSTINSYGVWHSLPLIPPSRFYTSAKYPTFHFRRESLTPHSSSVGFWPHCVAPPFFFAPFFFSKQNRPSRNTSRSLVLSVLSIGATPTRPHILISVIIRFMLDIVVKFPN